MLRRKLWTSVLAMSLSAVMILGVSGTVYAEEETTEAAETQRDNTEDVNVRETRIVLSDDVITVDGAEISADPAAAVYAGAEMIYYKAGQEATYGAGDEEDGHTEEEAAEHTVITITQPGTYRVSGSISKGQIAVDLGEDSREDADAVVNLILDNAEINCTAASAIVVFNAYECGSDDTETATKDVDTGAAGFNLILADGSENIINGSHVAKIYKEGTTQEQIDADEAKKAWKFDAAIDSLVSFNVNGEEDGNGKLVLTSDNEGMSSALHMTINGSEVIINSSDDAINASEDYVSVCTINGGTITCDSGFGEEGDGIDSNGWLVINGGYVITGANGSSQDSGIDSDMGIYINGGTVLAGGNMYDEISGDSAQPFMVLNFAQKAEEGQLLLLKNSADEPVAAFCGVNDYQILVYSGEDLADGDYTLYKVSSVTGDLNGSIYTNITDYTDAVQLQYSQSMGMGGGGTMMGGGRGEMPEGMEQGEIPEGMEQGEMPEGMEQGKMPEGMEQGEMPEGMEPGEMPSDAADGAFNGQNDSTPGTVFTISGISNIFSQITECTESVEEETKTAEAV